MLFADMQVFLNTKEKEGMKVFLDNYCAFSFSLLGSALLGIQSLITINYRIEKRRQLVEREERVIEHA
jgi:hypothetical protein